MTDRAECDGITLHHRGIIEVEKGLPAIEQANTMLHEVMHAVYYVQGMNCIDAKADDVEEKIINSLGNGLTQVFRDNPEFTASVMVRLGYGLTDEGEDDD